MSNSKKGVNNPNYNPDAIHRPNYEYLKREIKLGNITRSQLSGKSAEEDNAKLLVVHHIDGDTSNDNWSNLLVVTSREHNKIHKRGYSFWKSDRKDGKRLAKLVENNGKLVQSIKHVDITQHPNYGKSYGPKDLTVYTLSCYPYNTYLIDNMWVHNCDTQYACKGDDYKEMSVDDVVDEVLSYGVDRVTFTGGEPLIQPDADELINRLRVEGIEVNVETNGAVPLMDSAFRSNSYFYTMDWKSTSSGMSDKMISDNLYKLGEQDVLKFVVSTEDDLNQMKDILSQLEKELLSYGSKIEFQVYVSPIFGEIEPKELVECVLENHLNNVHVQVQLHKVIWDPDKRGV